MVAVVVDEDAVVLIEGDAMENRTKISPAPTRRRTDKTTNRMVDDEFEEE